MEPVRALVLGELGDSCEGDWRVRTERRGCKETDVVGLVGDEDDVLVDVD